jgi:hypothetical protein
MVSPTAGAIVVEVKGGQISVREGRWYQYDRALERSPVDQVISAKHELVRRLRSAGVDLTDLFIRHVVALPDVGAIPAEGLGLQAPSASLWAKAELASPVPAVAALVDRPQRPVPPERLAAFVTALRPTVDLAIDERGVMAATARALDQAARAGLAATIGLDANRRVLVTGGAGTGKTRLVLDWARRAVARGERTAVVCFNVPMAEVLRRELAETPATVGTYHDLALGLLAPYGFQVGSNPNRDYWEHIPTQGLAVHAERIGTPFDTIVIDEGQDMRPHWMASLERLFDPAGPCRLLMVADPRQAIYVSPWTAPPDMVRTELTYNLRNAQPIAEVVAHLGGPSLTSPTPSRIPVAFTAVGGAKELRKAVRSTVVGLNSVHHVPFGDIAVLTTHTDSRDVLLSQPLEGCPLTRWEQRSESAVVCETVQRTKGLERQAVIVVDTTDDPDPVLVYIGASRAVSWLTLIGRPRLAEVAGVAVDKR